MTIKYTDKELSAAKDFLRKRLDSEQSMHDDVERLLVEYAKLLVDALALSGGYGNVLIENLLESLRDELLYDCELLALDEGREDSRDGILAYMHEKRNGKTLKERIDERVKTFYNEVYAAYLAGKLLGLTKYAVLMSVLGSMKTPYDNEHIKDVRNKIATGEVSGNMDVFEKPHFGQGIEISSLGALKTITGYAVGDAWMWWQYEDAVKNGANGYVVKRGSNYPCEECDSHTGRFYRIDDDENRPQYHLRCCCVIVYLHVDEKDFDNEY